MREKTEELKTVIILTEKRDNTGRSNIIEVLGHDLTVGMADQVIREALGATKDKLQSIDIRLYEN